MRRVAFVFAVLAAITGCSRDFFDPTPGRSAAPPPSVELIGRGVRMLPGDQNAIRISFSPKQPSARIRIERSSNAGRVIACPLQTLDGSISEARGCLPDLPDGVRESLTAPGLGAIGLLREGDPIQIDVRLEYEQGGRAFAIRIPDIARSPGSAACADYACSPVFESRPVRGGRFTATVRWEGGNGRVELLEGSVLARSLTSTGIPYRIAATATGPSALSVRSQLNAPSEYALAITNLGEGDFSSIAIDARWP